jgi:16S rRNA (uracil1498-N3)-methyltransferase
VNQPGARAHERWTRILCESCKQSRRAWLPTLVEPCAPEDVAAWAARRGPVVLLDPSGEPAATLVAHPALRRAPDVWLVVGPEGGLDDDERGRLLGGGARPMSLSDGILRIETAVVAGLALLGQLRD